MIYLVLLIPLAFIVFGLVAISTNFGRDIGEKK